MTVCALVVSHNREQLLRECLEGLAAQDLRPDEIILVDNVSTDGTVAMVRSEYPSVLIVESGENLGGAGGFALGIDVAIARGHDSVWLMDDDARPLPGALRIVCDEMEKDPDHRPGFVASTVVDYDGAILGSHVPLDITGSENHGFDPTPTTYPSAYATFVGVLVNLRVARYTALPVVDFFIWWDDTEYTSRLQRLAGGITCRNSLIMHPDKPMAVSRDIGGRLIPDMRNRLWILRDRRLASEWGRRKARGEFVWRVIHQAVYSRNKLSYLKNLVTGLGQGLLTRPTLVRPGDMIARWEATQSSRLPS